MSYRDANSHEIKKRRPQAALDMSDMKDAVLVLFIDRMVQMNCLFIPMQSTMKKYVCKVTKKCYTKENERGTPARVSARWKMAVQYD